MFDNVSKETLEIILHTLPVEFSFVDDTDTVRIFNKNGDRIFPRPRSVIGKRVQDCHPSKSLHKVQQIIDEMKTGARDAADFWINYKGMKVSIRYLAVRDKDGKYLGCLEVSQDITDLQKIDGEKRLLT
ncbi:MAG: PAS domain-containing protein [Candidatus Bathyarchaeota archaeon]|nr:PAS domain-containing protein [Candidatus Bathyarchaeota archaeon]